MAEPPRDRSDIDPLTGAHEPIRVDRGPDGANERPTHAASADIPGTGELVTATDGREFKRVVRT